jgi:hypothetical protein
MAFPFRNPRVARGARFSARDPNKEIEVYDPEGVLSRINHTLRRRLADRVEALFQATCVAGQLDTADDLVTVLANVVERGRRAFGVERRISDDPVAKAREDLSVRRFEKGPQSP